MGVPAGVTQEEGHTGFLHLPSAVLALTFIARRIQPFLSLVDREVETFVYPLIYRFLLAGNDFYFLFHFLFGEKKSQFSTVQYTYGVCVCVCIY